MSAYLALFRGINVGGKNLLPMKELTSMMASIGCGSARTYIQSGNAVFTYDGDMKHLSAQLSDVIEQQKGFRPNIHILSASDFKHIAAQNPYTGMDADPKTVHINFLISPAEKANLPAIKELQTETEQFELTRQAFFLYAPDGIGRSKLVAKLEQLLGVPITGRNLRTIKKLGEMLSDVVTNDQ